MSRSTWFMICLMFWGLTAAPLAVAQQFSVYTRVERVPPDDNAGSKPELMARSLSLFYASKVYDWIQQVGEVTIFEPTHNRFIILNTRKMLVTVVSFDEILRLLDAAHDETKSYALRLRERSSRDAAQFAEPLLFQLAPKFQANFEPTDHKLYLTSPRFSYFVDCQDPDISESAEAYLNYADWAARLNHVLHPQSLYPEPRLQLNQALRAHHQIPIKVQLRVNFDKPLHLQAEHRFGWELTNDNRQWIHHWEQLLKSDQLKEVSFREYQQAILMGPTQARK